MLEVMAAGGGSHRRDHRAGIFGGGALRMLLHADAAPQGANEDGLAEEEAAEAAFEVCWASQVVDGQEEARQAVDWRLGLHSSCRCHFRQVFAQFSVMR